MEQTESHNTILFLWICFLAGIASLLLNERSFAPPSTPYHLDVAFTPPGCFTISALPSMPYPLDLAFTPPCCFTISAPPSTPYLAFTPPGCFTISEPPSTPHILELAFTPPGCFTIHGLWPPKQTKTKIVNFHEMEETIQTKDGGISNLNYIWPSLNKNSNRKFWKHEYNIHGRYFEGSQEEYFRTTVEMFNRLRDALDKLTLDARIMHNTSEIIDMVKEISGVRCVPMCSTCDGNKTNQTLSSIRFCFAAANAKAITNCPTNIPSDCKEEFWVAEC